MMKLTINDLEKFRIINFPTILEIKEKVKENPDIDLVMINALTGNDVMLELQRQVCEFFLANQTMVSDHMVQSGYDAMANHTYKFMYPMHDLNNHQVLVWILEFSVSPYASISVLSKSVNVVPIKICDAVNYDTARLYPFYLKFLQKDEKYYLTGVDFYDEEIEKEMELEKWEPSYLAKLQLALYENVQNILQERLKYLQWIENGLDQPAYIESHKLLYTRYFPPVIEALNQLQISIQNYTDLDPKVKEDTWEFLKEYIDQYYKQDKILRLQHYGTIPSWRPDDLYNNH